LLNTKTAQDKEEVLGRKSPSEDLTKRGIKPVYSRKTKLKEKTMPINVTRITNNSISDTSPQVSGTNVVWIAGNNAAA